MHYLLIFKYFVIAYELMFDIITSGLLLPVKRNTSEFREPILYQAKFLNTLTGSNNTTIYYYGFPIQMVMSSANNDLFLSSFSIIFIHIYFLFYCLARISKTLLDSSKHSWLVSKFIKKKMSNITFDYDVDQKFLARTLFGPIKISCSGTCFEFTGTILYQCP